MPWFDELRSRLWVSNLTRILLRSLSPNQIFTLFIRIFDVAFCKKKTEILSGHSWGIRPKNLIIYPNMSWGILVHFPGSLCQTKIYSKNLPNGDHRSLSNWIAWWWQMLALRLNLLRDPGQDKCNDCKWKPGVAKEGQLTEKIEAQRKWRELRPGSEGDAKDADDPSVAQRVQVDDVVMTLMENKVPIEGFSMILMEATTGASTCQSPAFGV